MGLMSTSWTASYKGHSIKITRNEITRGVAVEWDGTRIAEKRRSLLGVGETRAEAELEGKRVPISARLFFPAKCRLTIGGETVATTRVG